MLTAADEAGRTTTNTFDTEGRLVSTSAPGQAKVEYVYDQAGNLLKLRVDEDALRETDYTYDILNRKTLERFPAGQGGRTERTFTYDEAGNVNLYTDGRGVQADLSDRDGVGRILTKTFSVPGGHPEIPGVPAVSYGYDNNGNLTGLSNANGSCSWGFDSLDRLTTESVASGPAITYTHDPRGVVLTETVGSYAKLHSTHSYDAAGRRLSTTQDGQTTSFEWDNAMRRTKVTLPNGVETAYAFDTAERIDTIQYKKGTVFENYDYSYDTVGNPTSVATSNGTYAYGYDAAYRLTSESRTTFQAYSASHTYDSVGNRLTRTIDSVTRTYAYNKADQLTGWTQGTKEGVNTFDLDGNMTAKQVKTSGVATDLWSFDFDAAGRMASGTQSIGGTQSTSNTYVGDQWYRVSSTTNGTTLKYGWKQDALFAEFNSSNDLVAGYLNDGVDQPLYKTRFSGNGSVVDGRDFYHKDANWRVHHVTDGSGAISEKYVYNAYGKRTILDSANVVLGASGIGNRIGFQGREHEDVDSEAQEDGLTFHRWRFYDPDMGGWERRDTFPFESGLPFGPYAFENANPTTYLDPSGEHPIVVWLVLAAFGLKIASLGDDNPVWSEGSRHFTSAAFSMATLPAGGFAYRFSAELLKKGGANLLTQMLVGSAAAGVTHQAATDTLTGRIADYPDDPEGALKSAGINAGLWFLGSALFGPGSASSSASEEELCWRLRWWRHGKHTMVDVAPKNAPRSTLVGFGPENLGPGGEIPLKGPGAVKVQQVRTDTLFRTMDFNGERLITKTEAEAVLRKVNEYYVNPPEYNLFSTPLGPGANCTTFPARCMNEAGVGTYGLTGPSAPGLNPRADLNSLRTAGRLAPAGANEYWRQLLGREKKDKGDPFLRLKVEQVR